MQCSAYAVMFGELTGIEVNRIVVAIANEQGQPQMFIRNKNDYLQALHDQIKRYKSS